MPESDYEKVLMTIGKNIKTERIAQGMNRTTLAGKAGYNRNGLLQLEEGRKDIKLETLLKIAKVLNVEPASLCIRTYEIDRQRYASSFLEDDYLLIFSENVKTYLKRLNRQAYYITNIKGIDQTTLSRIFNGKIRNPRISTLNEIAYCVNSDLAILLKRYNQEEKK